MRINKVNTILFFYPASGIKMLAKAVFNRAVCSFIFICSFFLSTGQSTASFNRSDTSTVIEEKLVALALQGPQAKILDHQNKINEYQLKAAQTQMLNLLAFSINYNEQSFKPQTPTSFVYPKYNLGVTIPVGTLFSRTATKSARESIEIGKNNKELLKRSIREDVITRYRQYKAIQELIALQSEMLNDVQTELVQAEEKFRKGTITIDAYNAAQKGYNGERAALINLRLEQDIKKLEIERFIGVKLETVTGK